MKKKRNLIPKRIAGVKVPKAARKSKLLRSLIRSPLGREILADALTAGAAAAAATLLQRREDVADAGGAGARKAGAKKGASAVGVMTEAIRSATDAVRDVVGNAVNSMLPAEATRGAAKGKRGGRPAGPTSH